jgi:serine/threonine-protein phosphatase 2A regulatory subunit B'
MVYNAMKLFMEVNPQLFDDCSHHYAEQQSGEAQRQKDRQARWDRLSQLAAARQNGRISTTSTDASGQTGRPNQVLPRLDEADSQESQRRLEALRLRDDESSGDSVMTRRRGDDLKRQDRGMPNRTRSSEIGKNRLSLGVFPLMKPAD